MWNTKIWTRLVISFVDTSTLKYPWQKSPSPIGSTRMWCNQSQKIFYWVLRWENYVPTNQWLNCFSNWSAKNKVSDSYIDKGWCKGYLDARRWHFCENETSEFDSRVMKNQDEPIACFRAFSKSRNFQQKLYFFHDRHLVCAYNVP